MKTPINKSSGRIPEDKQRKDATPKAKTVQKFSFEDNRPEAIQQQKIKELANNSPQAHQLRTQQDIIRNGSHSKASTPSPVIQAKPNKTGLPDRLKEGVESLSGHSMDDVKVHYNSSKPEDLQAHAYAQGSNIHIAPGQEGHLPHEAWHVVQQKQGRVQATTQLKGNVPVNDDQRLEREADIMGAKALNAHQSTPLNHPSKVAQKFSIYQLVNDKKKGQGKAKEATPPKIDPKHDPAQSTKTVKVYLEQEVIYHGYTAKGAIEKIGAFDSKHIGEENDKKKNPQRDEFDKKRKALIDEYNNLLKNDGSKPAKDASKFIENLSSYLQENDPFDQKIKDEKIANAEELVRFLTINHLEAESYDLKGYKDALTKKIIDDPNLIKTLRGYDNIKRLHLADDSEQEVTHAIHSAVDNIRKDNLYERLPNKQKNKNWKEWRESDCVFAALLYIENDMKEKYSESDKENEGFDETAESKDTGSIADHLGLHHGTVPDSVLFHLMEELECTYLPNLTWDKLKKQHSSGAYIVSVHQTTIGDYYGYHVIIYDNGKVYDRQGKRINNKFFSDTSHKDFPLDAWQINPQAIKAALTGRP